jgi:transcriptional regulator with XRE-family HTH domain
MGLVELGKHTGLSASFLSQLETGRVVPTLRNLARIAMVFSKDLSYFFETEPNSLFRIHRRKERVRMPQTGVEFPTYFFESLGYMVPDRPMDPYFAEFIPLTKEMEPKGHMHPGFEFLYLLDGELELRHGDHECKLEIGDAAYFDASTPHSYQCVGKKPAGAIIVTMHQAPPAMQAVPRPAVVGAKPATAGVLRESGREHL